MVTDLRSRETDVVLRDHARETWEKLSTIHQDEFRAGMCRALFDDVRPAWELLPSMYRALFDDVRPAWELYLPGAARKLAA